MLDGISLLRKTRRLRQCRGQTVPVCSARLNQSKSPGPWCNPGLSRPAGCPWCWLLSKELVWGAEITRGSEGRVGSHVPVKTKLGDQRHACHLRRKGEPHVRNRAGASQGLKKELRGQIVAVFLVH